VWETLYLLYLDASGDPGWPSPIGKSKSRYYILAGLAIKPDKWENINEALKNLIKQYFSNKPSMPSEIKYSEILGKKGPWGFLSKDELKKFTDDLLQLLRNLSPVLFSIVVKKLEHYKRYTQPERPNRLALRYIVPRFSKFLQRIDDYGIMIYDAEVARSDTELRHFLIKSRDVGIVLGGNPFFDPWALFRTQNKLERIVESIFFIDSSASPVIQLTDFCANSIFAHFELGKSYRFEKIYSLFDREDKNIYGLKIWPEEQETPPPTGVASTNPHTVGSPVPY